MNETDISLIVAELHRKHPEPTGICDLSDLELTLALLPDQGVWRISDSTPTVLALAPEDTLFTVTLGRSPGPQLPCAATLSSRVVDGEKLVARLEWGEYRHMSDGETWRDTHWVFRCGNQDDAELEEWQRVTGRVRTHPEPEELDHDEQYARGLLSRIGHRVA